MKNKRWSVSLLLWVSLCEQMMSMWQQWKGTMVIGGALARNELKWRHVWWVGRMTVEDGSRTVQRDWSVTVVWIQCLYFDLRSKTTGRSVAERWNWGSELVLARSKGSVTRHDTTAWWYRPEERRHRGEERDETTPIKLTWILLDQKIKKIHTINSAPTNGWRRFKTIIS
jgi:hypothetical protein